MALLKLDDQQLHEIIGGIHTGVNKTLIERMRVAATFANSLDKGNEMVAQVNENLRLMQNEYNNKVLVATKEHLAEAQKHLDIEDYLSKLDLGLVKQTTLESAKTGLSVDEIKC